MSHEVRLAGTMVQVGVIVWSNQSMAVASSESPSAPAVGSPTSLKVTGLLVAEHRS